MVAAAILSFVIGIVAAFVGFSGVAGAAGVEVNIVWAVAAVSIVLALVFGWIGTGRREPPI
jgi:uncharacterized membrane protein YtjA (UPF0391 family)